MIFYNYIFVSRVLANATGRKKIGDCLEKYDHRGVELIVFFFYFR